jgi:ABC-type nitrate/sulfonate/bicarbonate transport system substrate-binding protein
MPGLTMSWWSLFLGAVCSFAFQEPVYGQEKKSAKFLLSNSTISESRAPLYMAKDLRLFEKYGLDTQIVNIRGAAVNIASLMAGEIQMAAANGAIAMTAAARGAPIVIVATVGPTVYSLVSKRALTIQQLKGKTIGIGGFGVGDYFTMRRLLHRLGLSPENDVTLFPTGTTSSFERINIMMTGKVDAVLATQGNIDRIEMRGIKLNVIAGTEEQGVDVSGGDFFTTRQFLKTGREQIKAMLRAFSDAVKIGRENREVFHRAVRSFLREDNPQLLDRLYENHYFLGKHPHSARPLEKALDLDIQDMAASVPEFKGRRAAEFIDATVLREVENEGFFAWAKP